MKKFRRLSAAVLAAVMCFSMASCDIADTETEITNSNIKIGIVLPGKDKLEDFESNDLSSIITLNSVNKLINEKYGIGEDRFHYEININPEKSDEVNDAITSLTNQECNIIILSDAGYSDEIAAAAKDHSGTQFLVYNYTGATTPEGNIHKFFANITAAQYLSGIVAGMKAQELKINTIGFLVKNGADLTSLNAFAEGVKSVNPAAKINAKISADAKADAEALAKSGCAVLAADFYSDDIDDVAISNDVFFCGFGTDQYRNSEQNKDAESKMLCSTEYNFEQYFINSIKAMVDNSAENKENEDSDKEPVALKLDDCQGSYANGNTYLSDIISKNAAPGTDAKVQEAAAKLLNGTISFTINAAKPVANVTLTK